MIYVSLYPIIVPRLNTTSISPEHIRQDTQAAINGLAYCYSMPIQRNQFEVPIPKDSISGPILEISCSDLQRREGTKLEAQLKATLWQII